MSAMTITDLSDKRHPLRRRSTLDKQCVWFAQDRKPVRMYCTNMVRDADGGLFLERRGARRNVLRNAKPILHPVILVEALG